jgi:hypothetical protein
LTARRIALPLSAFRRIKNNPPCGLSSLARGIFLFGSFLRRFDRRFRRRGGFPFVDRRVNGTLKNVFEVTDEAGSVIDTLPRLKDAKAKYAEI